MTINPKRLYAHIAYGEHPPEYVRACGKNFIKIAVEGVITGDPEVVKITPADLAEYYRTQARNISSGCRSLCGVVGDWRMIDNLAQEALDYFKVINIKEMRKAARAVGLEPRF